MRISAPLEHTIAPPYMRYKHQHILQNFSFFFVLVEVVINWKLNSHNCEIPSSNPGHNVQPNNFGIFCKTFPLIESNSIQWTLDNNMDIISCRTSTLIYDKYKYYLI
jgi:hypothetical protein